MQVPEKNNDLNKLNKVSMIKKAIILSLILLFFSHPSLYANMDSTGIKKIEGKLFVLYKVDPGQGLYGLARRYKTTVADIQKANPGIGQTLSVGQTILVPYSGGALKIVKITDKKKSEKQVSKKTEKPLEAGVKPVLTEGKEPIYHTVTKKETVFQIAANHKLSIDQLKSWNQVDLNKILPGEKIIVGYKTLSVNRDKTKPDKITTSKTKSSSSLKSKQKIHEEIKPAVSNSEPQKTVTENGMGTWVDDGSIGDISLAMHKTAPAGTIIRLTNPMNGKVKYVKVIGQLPETDDNNLIIIKIGKNTAGDLGIIDKNFRVRLDYSVTDTTGK